MSHLSELSVQLRKLQTEKNAQANEIDRLERQVRILSDLKGICITDLQAALRSACESEAHGELHAIVGKLQARIDGLQLGGGGGLGAKAKGGLLDEVNHVPTQDQFNEEAAKRARTALELRIGELEEIESTLRTELDALYQNSQKMTERNTLLETQVMQQKAQLEQWERRWKAKEEEEMQRSGLVPMPSPSAGSYNYSEFATPNGNGVPPPQPILLHNAPQSEIDTQHEQRALAAEAALAGEKQQRSLVQSQLSSTQKSYELKVEQYQHRIQFLEGQTRDLEQQMSSLYAAFGIMQDDNKEEREEKEAWKQTLLASDAAIAQEQTKVQMKDQFKGGSTPSEKKTPKSERSLVPFGKSRSPLTSSSKAAVRPASHPPIAKGLLLLLLDKDDQPLPPNPPSPENSQHRRRSGKMPSFKLHKSPSSRSGSGLKFKRQYVVLHGANGLYQIRYGDTYTGPVSGVCEFITTELLCLSRPLMICSLQHTPRSSSQQFGFEIMINPLNIDAPSLCCAADSEEDFMMWMSALTSVIDGTVEPPPTQHHLAAV
ncbi:hypothetical protein ACHAWF_005710 [Thalassiosira exigua]